MEFARTRYDLVMVLRHVNFAFSSRLLVDEPQNSKVIPCGFSPMANSVLCQCPVCSEYTCRDPNSKEEVRGQIIGVGDAKRHRAASKKGIKPPLINKTEALQELDRQVMGISLLGPSAMKDGNLEASDHQDDCDVAKR